jgi:Leucine-rich repeat (LRR) protein
VKRDWPSRTLDYWYIENGSQLGLSRWTDEIPDIIADKKIEFLRLDTTDQGVAEKVSKHSKGISRVEVRQPLESLDALYDFADLKDLALAQSSDHLDFRRLPALKSMLVSFERGEFTNLAASRLTELHIVNCKGLRDLEAVAAVRNLEVLTLADTRLSSLAELAKLRKLRALYVENSPVENVDGLEEAPSLANLLIALSRVTTLAPLTKAPRLERLMLYDMRKVTDAECVTAMPRLKSLKIEGMPLPPLDSLAKLRSIEGLFLKSKVAFPSLEFLRGLRELRVLDLHGSVTDSDVSVLLELPELRWFMFDARRHHRPAFDDLVEEIARRHGVRRGAGGRAMGWKDPWPTSWPSKEE